MSATPDLGPRWTPLAVVIFLAGLSLLLLTTIPPSLWPGRELPHNSCLSNAKQLAGALRMYMSDYDGYLPPAAAWQDVTYPYVKNEVTYRCWLRPRVNPGFALNQALDGRVGSEIPMPEKTPLIHESRIGRRNAADRLESFVTPHYGYGSVAFADGHAKALKAAPAAVPQPGSALP